MARITGSYPDGFDLLNEGAVEAAYEAEAAMELAFRDEDADDEG